MTGRLLTLLAGLLVITSVGAASPRVHHPVLLAQRGGPRTCATDANCSGTRVPPPRACPHGGQSVATACCRMGYCGVCWSDCPQSGQ